MLSHYLAHVVILAGCTFAGWCVGYRLGFRDASNQAAAYHRRRQRIRDTVRLSPTARNGRREHTGGKIQW